MKKRILIITMAIIMALSVLTACGGEEITPLTDDNPVGYTDDLVLPEDLLQPTVTPTPEMMVAPMPIGTWDYLTTALGDGDNLSFEPIISPAPTYLEVSDNNIIQMFSQESVIKAVFTQTSNSQDSQYELLVTELSQSYEDSTEWFTPEFDVALSYDAENGVLRWTFLEGTAYITNVHHYYIISFESMDKEVSITIDDYNVTVDEENGMDWEKYTLPRLAVYAHYMDGAYSEGTSRELYRRFIEIPHIVLPYIALIGDETIRDDLPMPATRDLLCSSIVYGGDFTQNSPERFLELLDMYDALYPSGGVADVIANLRESAR